MVDFMVTRHEICMLKKYNRGNKYNMAEFCLDCLNKLNNTQLDESNVQLSDYEDFCEGCADYKNVVVKINAYWNY